MKYFFIMMLSLTLVSWNRQDMPNDPHQSENNDNTEKNIRDRDTMAITPLDQSESEVDRTITQKIRQAIVSDDNLSMNAKNIKIVTINRVVTLRGPVASPQEKEAITRKINDIPGITKVDNQLEITRD